MTTCLLNDGLMVTCLLNDGLMITCVLNDRLTMTCLLNDGLMITCLLKRLGYKYRNIYNPNMSVSRMIGNNGLFIFTNGSMQWLW